MDEGLLGVSISDPTAHFGSCLAGSELNGWLTSMAFIKIRDQIRLSSFSRYVAKRGI
jgi:hypothetical protein